MWLYNILSWMDIILDYGTYYYCPCMFMAIDGQLQRDILIPKWFISLRVVAPAHCSRCHGHHRPSKDDVRPAGRERGPPPKRRSASAAAVGLLTSICGRFLFPSVSCIGGRLFLAIPWKDRVVQRTEAHPSTFRDTGKQTINRYRSNRSSRRRSYRRLRASR